jgi:hypothetical protein
MAIIKKKDNIFSNGSFNHVFHGEINKKRKAVGYHHESMMGGKIIEITDPPNKYGVYRGIVEIEGKNKKVPSTFFPSDWNRVQVRDRQEFCVNENPNLCSVRPLSLFSSFKQAY